MAFNDIPKPPGAKRVGLDVGPEDLAALRVLAGRAGVSVAVLCRAAVALVADGVYDPELTVQKVKRWAWANRKPAPPPKRPRGRPRKQEPTA